MDGWLDGSMARWMAGDGCWMAGYWDWSCRYAVPRGSKDNNSSNWAKSAKLRGQFVGCRNPRIGKKGLAWGCEGGVDSRVTHTPPSITITNHPPSTNSDRSSNLHLQPAAAAPVASQGTIEQRGEEPALQHSKPVFDFILRCISSNTTIHQSIKMLGN